MQKELAKEGQLKICAAIVWTFQSHTIVTLNPKNVSWLDGTKYWLHSDSWQGQALVLKKAWKIWSWHYIGEGLYLLGVISPFRELKILKIPFARQKYDKLNESAFHHWPICPVCFSCVSVKHATTSRLQVIGRRVIQRVNKTPTIMVYFHSDAEPPSKKQSLSKQ